ncbi:hypothetical protein DID78_04885 [Candidatus Marinamargulisbacteria bacterium SCGC AG-343-D04]|nr:hypothetical protein DID78_04885 [Candidatus Marinamargulisbacteria bacterium SCGC AG-343-D04]
MTKKYCSIHKDIQPKFSNVPKTYDDYGLAQQHSYSVLTSQLPDKASTVLDLGCGTGKHTSDLHQRIKSKKTVGIDQSLPMIKYARKYHAFKEVDFIHADIEDFYPKMSVDIIFSNATLQWVTSNEVIQRVCKESMHDTTQFIFSAFLPGTFKELSESLDDLFERRVDFPCHSFRDVDDYKALVKPLFRRCEFSRKKIIVVFDSVKELLMSIKKTGVANEVSPIFLTPKKLQRLHEMMSKREGVVGSYDVGFFKCY